MISVAPANSKNKSEYKITVCKDAEKFSTTYDHTTLERFAKALLPRSKNSLPDFPDSSSKKSHETINQWFGDFSFQNKDISFAEYKKLLLQSNSDQESSPRSNSSTVRRRLKDSFRPRSVTIGRPKSPIPAPNDDKELDYLEFVSRLECGFVPISGRKKSSLAKSTATVPKKHMSTRSPASEETPNYLETQEFLEPYKTTQPMTENDLLTKCFKLLQSSQREKLIVENVLKLVLKFTKANHLYLVRHELGELMLETIMTSTQTWSILESIPLSMKQKKEQFADILIAKKEMKSIHTHNTSQDVRIASSLSIPLILQNNFVGAVKIVHGTSTTIFDDTPALLISSLILNLFSVINTHLAKRKAVKEHKEIVQLPCVKQLHHVILQDSFYLYNSNSRKFSSCYGVLADFKLMIFKTQFDMHAKEKIYLGAVKRVEVCLPRKSKKNAKRIKSALPVCNKRFSQYHLIYIKSLEGETWLAMETAEAAEDWKSSLESQCRLKEKPTNIPSNIRINSREVTKGKIIGQGAAAIVYQGIYQQTPVAVKQLMDQFDESEVKAFFDEMNILQNLHHPNIVNLFGGFISDEEKPSIVFEFAMRGSLSSVLYNQLTTLTNEMKLRILIQTARALSYLHSFEPPIIHRDLKPANILITEDWTAKLADFGLARTVASDMTTGQGTVKWMAPEVLSNAPYTTKADIYSFGLIIWEIVAARPFFEEFTFNSQIEVQVVNHNTRPPLTLFSPPLQKVIQQTWHPDPNERPTAATLISMMLTWIPDDLIEAQQLE